MVANYEPNWGSSSLLVIVALGWMKST